MTDTLIEALQGCEGFTPKKRIHFYLLDTKLGGTRSRSGDSGEVKVRINPGFQLPMFRIGNLHTALTSANFQYLSSLFFLYFPHISTNVFCIG